MGNKYGIPSINKYSNIASIALATGKRFLCAQTLPYAHAADGRLTFGRGGQQSMPRG
jgi:hypothetical protein